MTKIKIKINSGLEYKSQQSLSFKQIHQGITIESSELSIQNRKKKGYSQM